MADNFEILPVHGWAFDDGVWNRFKELAPDHIRFLEWDRGYFHQPKGSSITPDSANRIILTHSFGLHLIPENMLISIDMLIIIGGFIEFHPGTPQFRKRSKAVLQNMIEQMHKNPKKVLNDFYQNFYKPDEVSYKPGGRLNKKLLIEDLVTLHQGKCSVSALRNVPQICILHGTNDNIVPNIKGRELYNRLGDNASYFEIKDASHALPVTHAEMCWNFIQPEIYQEQAK